MCRFRACVLVSILTVFVQAEECHDGKHCDQTAEDSEENILVQTRVQLHDQVLSLDPQGEYGQELMSGRCESIMTSSDCVQMADDLGIVFAGYQKTAGTRGCLINRWMGVTIWYNSDALWTTDCGTNNYGCLCDGMQGSDADDDDYYYYDYDDDSDDDDAASGKGGKGGKGRKGGEGAANRAAKQEAFKKAKAEKKAANAAAQAEKEAAKAEREAAKTGKGDKITLVENENTTIWADDANWVDDAITLVENENTTIWADDANWVDDAIPR